MQVQHIGQGHRDRVIALPHVGARVLAGSEVNGTGESPVEGYVSIATTSGEAVEFTGTSDQLEMIGRAFLVAATTAHDLEYDAALDAAERVSKATDGQWSGWDADTLHALARLLEADEPAGTKRHSAASRLHAAARRVGGGAA